jgi:bifunctional non-homologous end joining protein LigD
MTQVQVGERTLSLSNLDKVLYPEAGFTKGQVIDYYARIAPIMLPHLAARALTFKRFPDGVDKPGFFEKRCPKHRPDWVPVATGPGDRGGPIGTASSTRPRSSANLAASNCTHRWRAADLSRRAVVSTRSRRRRRCAMRPVTLIRTMPDKSACRAWPKTSGSKGMQIYVPVNSPLTHEQASSFALAVGQVLEKQQPDSVLTSMAKKDRKNKIFVDWSQNNRHKTTIAPYSLRAREQPTVSTPVSWDEVAAAADGDADLRFEGADVLARVERDGDLFAPVLTERQTLPH